MKSHAKKAIALSGGAAILVLGVGFGGGDLSPSRGTTTRSSSIALTFRSPLPPQEHSAHLGAAVHERNLVTHTVGDAAKVIGFSAKAIRIWEAKGLLPPAERTDAGYRLFSDDDVGDPAIHRAGPDPRLNPVGDQRHPRPASPRHGAL
ncbi:MerR family DNA-binding transcriptional regulator [Mycobacterium sp. SM1]|uniref:MerR family DNA-binding transcriptional regulator n=1 Tax=Mycobacterium sp. SM1 TaxID=2816243 RepID=UPI001F2A2A34|nr:MerR family DNA-binding transcriptional regulator [Mycobacterium sp. SM1]